MLAGVRTADGEITTISTRTTKIPINIRGLEYAVDANFGYAWQVAPWGVLSTRYRIQLYNLLENDLRIVGRDIQFGPEVNFSIKLN